MIGLDDITNSGNFIDEIGDFTLKVKTRKQPNQLRIRKVSKFMPTLQIDSTVSKNRFALKSKFYQAS